MAMPLSPAIQITATPPAQDKPFPAASADTSFNHVLNNEMSQQQNAKTAASATHTPATSNSPATQTATDAKSRKTADTSQADAANAAASLQSALPPISAELLAMMGNYPVAHISPAAPAMATGASGPTNAGNVPANNTPAAARYQQTVLTTAPLLPVSAAATAAAATKINDAVTGQAVPQTSSPTANKFAETLKTAVLSGNDTSPANLQQIQNPAPLPVTGMTPFLPNPATIAAAAQAASAPPSTGLGPSVGTAAWNQALGEKIVWMSGGGGEQTASLNLNPPDLGPLQVVLNVTNNQANATFIAAQPEVRLAIEAALPKLHEMMNNAGIQLGQTNVRSDTSSQQDRQPEAQSFRPLSGIRPLSADKTAGMSARLITGKGLVNTFV